MKNLIPKELPLLEEDGKNIVLFHPFIPKNAADYVNDTLHSRWIGQGPKVHKFEKEFNRKFCGNHTCVSVGSGTDALHLSYILSGLKPGDEVVTPVFTCTATNIPFLYMNVKPVFADIQKGTLNIDPNHVRELVNEKTKAIVCVHYAGLPCDMDELHEIATKWGIPVIEDGAHAVGAKYHGNNIGEI
jgi:dTDP-4-amino-4,6-dideoxygalactose transaminase